MTYEKRANVYRSRKASTANHSDEPRSGDEGQLIVAAVTRSGHFLLGGSGLSE